MTVLLQEMQASVPVNSIMHKNMYKYTSTEQVHTVRYQIGYVYCVVAAGLYVYSYVYMAAPVCAGAPSPVHLLLHLLLQPFLN